MLQKRTRFFITIIMSLLVVTISISYYVLQYRQEKKITITPSPSQNLAPITDITSSPIIAGDYVPPPTRGWKKPPEKHYDDDNFIFNARKKYLPREIWDVTLNKDNDLEKEEKAIRKAMDKDPTNREIQYLLAYNQFDREKYDEAIELFNSILRVSPNEERALEGRAYAYFKKENYETSRRMAEEALKKYPRNPRLLHILAGSYLFGERNPRKAIKIYEKAVKIDPNDVRLWLGWGESYLELKNKEASKKWLEILLKCIEKFPDYHIAYIVIGEEYQLQGDYARAIKFLEKSMTLDPAYYRAYAIIGDMLMGLGRYREAEEYYLRTLKTNPRYEALIYIQLGRLYKILNRTDLAEKYFREGVNVHKDNPEKNQEKAMALLELSRLASERKDFALAKTYIDQAIRDFPYYEYNHYYLALWWLDQGQFDEAEKELRKCYNQEKTEESMEPWEIEYGMCRIAAAKGDNVQAFQYLKKAMVTENNYRKIAIFYQAEKDRYLDNLRKTVEYGKLRNEMLALKESLGELKLNKSLLKLNYEDIEGDREGEGD